jgi:Tfp pilus assembly protein PilF
MQNSEARTRFLDHVQALIETEPDEALKKCVKALDDAPDDPALLYMIGNIWSKADHFGMALHLYKRALDLAPGNSQAWNNYGMALTGLHRYGEAREAFLNARKKCPTGARVELSNYTANVSLTYMEQGDRHKAIEWAEKALVIDPECQGAHQTIGFCSLALGDWKRGWPGYGKALGGKYRRIVKIGDESQWDGKPVDTLFCYGEQGLGDEIMMASCIPDAAKDVGKVVLECDRRLGGLFSRSFPFADVYATRKQNAVSWPTKYRIDAGVASGDLPGFYRPTPESCPGTPFLVADPERRLQWRALFDSWGRKPKIGIAWSGGLKHTNGAGRRIPLEAFKPLMDAIDADWVSLEYRAPGDEIARTGLPVRHYARAAQSDDYDDMAALVAELDFVIGVHTASVHLAGGLGVPGIALVPQKSPWNWSLPSMPWYGSISLHRQKQGESWLACIQRLASDKRLDWSGSAGSGSVSRVRAVDSRNCECAGGDQAAHAELAEVVS